MPRKIRPELSKANPYYISKHRYYELKHFCLQYHEWEKALCELRLLPNNSFEPSYSADISDPTSKDAERMYQLHTNIELVNRTVKEVGGYFEPWLRAGIVDERSYTYLSTVMRIPCCRDSYYDIYRRFFYELSKNRN